MQDFVHLHVHTQYSILDGQASISRLVDKAMANGMKGIAITDHGDMFGIKEFFNYVNKKNGGTNGEIKDLKKKVAALESGKVESENPEADIAACKEQIEVAKKKLFKPIIGCEMYVARNRLTDKNGKTEDTLRMVPSAAFSVEDSGNGQVTLYGGGLGHGIGMSQYGADGMAREGKNFREILSFFFPGTEISGG